MLRSILRARALCSCNCEFAQEVELFKHVRLEQDATKVVANKTIIFVNTHILAWGSSFFIHRPPS